MVDDLEHVHEYARTLIDLLDGPGHTQVTLKTRTLPDGEEEISVSTYLLRALLQMALGIEVHTLAYWEQVHRRAIEAEIEAEETP